MVCDECPAAHVRGGDGDRSKTVSIQGTSAVVNHLEVSTSHGGFLQNGKIIEGHPQDWRVCFPKVALSFLASEPAFVLMCTLKLGMQTLQFEPAELY